MTISEFLRTLTVEEEDRVLTGKMRPGSYRRNEGMGPCLVGTICVKMDDLIGRATRHDERDRSVESYYDDFCTRFGLEATNNAIRNRILRNRLQRALALRHGEPVVAVEV